MAKLTIEVPDSVAARAEAQAERLGTDVSDVVRRALVEHLGWQAIERIQDRFDLDEETALSIAYEELDACRGERSSARPA